MFEKQRCSLRVDVFWVPGTAHVLKFMCEWYVRVVGQAALAWILATFPNRLSSQFVDFNLLLEYHSVQRRRGQKGVTSYWKGLYASCANDASTPVASFLHSVLTSLLWYWDCKCTFTHTERCTGSNPIPKGPTVNMELYGHELYYIFGKMLHGWKHVKREVKAYRTMMRRYRNVLRVYMCLRFAAIKHLQ